MDAIGRDHDIGGRTHSIGETDYGLLIVLLEAGASVTGLHDVVGQPVEEHSKQVRAMHPVELDLGHRLGGPKGCDIGTVHAAKLRV